MVLNDWYLDQPLKFQLSQHPHHHRIAIWEFGYWFAFTTAAVSCTPILIIYDAPW